MKTLRPYSRPTASETGRSPDIWLARPLGDNDAAKLGDPQIYKMSFIEKLNQILVHEIADFLSTTNLIQCSLHVLLWTLLTLTILLVGDLGEKQCKITRILISFSLRSPELCKNLAGIDQI